MEKIHYPWFKKEDINAFFALFQNNLANFVVIAITMLGMGYPARIVYGMVIPGAAVSVLFGNFYYSHMAKRLAEKEQRTDVTALAYGVATPSMFIFLFGVLKPALDLTGDPDVAITIGMAACFMGGIIEMIGSAVGPWLRKNLPRASMLGALAGVAFSVIAGQMFFNTFESPIIGMFVMVIVFIGLIAQKRMPFRIPASLFAIIIGTVLAYATKTADLSAITDGLGHVGFYLPIPTLAVFKGFKLLFGPMVSLFAALIPISVYNFIETMNNVEAMDSAGDDYNVGEAQFVDGAGTIIGTLFGGTFPTTVYLASTSSKVLGAGRGYSIINGIVFLIASTFGIIAAMAEIIPLPVVAPILVFVGVSMISQMFSSIPQRHFPAAIIAMFPYLANFLSTKFGSAATEVLASEVSPAVVPLGQGAMFTGIILGAIIVFIIESEYNKAAITALVAAVMTSLGFMHAPELKIMHDPEFVLGYVIAAVTLVIFGYIADSDSDVGDDDTPITME